MRYFLHAGGIKNVKRVAGYKERWQNVELGPDNPRYKPAYFPYCCVFVMELVGLIYFFIHQDISRLVIISLILITCVFDQVGRYCRVV